MYYHSWIPEKAEIQGNNLTHENFQTFTKTFSGKQIFPF